MGVSLLFGVSLFRRIEVVVDPAQVFFQESLNNRLPFWAFGHTFSPICPGILALRIQ